MGKLTKRWLNLSYSTDGVKAIDILADSVNNIYHELSYKVPLSGTDLISGDLIPLSGVSVNLGSSGRLFADIFISTYGSIKTIFDTVSADTSFLSSAIDTNIANIITLSSDISNLSSAIDINIANITTLSSDLDDLTVVVADNTFDIGVNTVNIGILNSDVSNLSSDIDTNTDDIA